MFYVVLTLKIVPVSLSPCLSFPLSPCLPSSVPTVSLSFCCLLLPGSAREEASEWLHARVRKLLNAGPEGSDLHLQTQQGLYSRPPPVRSATRRGDTLTGVYVTVQDVIAFSEALAELVSKAQDRLSQQLRRLLASSKHVADSALWLAGTGDALRAEALDKVGNNLLTPIKQPINTYWRHWTKYVKKILVCTHHITPFIHPLYTCVTIFTPMYTCYTCITPYIHHIYT